MFQFLIGRVKRHLGVFKFDAEGLFQFLIGRVKRRTWGRNLLLSICCFNSLQVESKVPQNNLNHFFHFKFQFLIGRVKSIQLERAVHRRLRVSIPYRQSQKNFTTSFTTVSKHCFNSLQVESKDGWKIRIYFYITCFNSLQVESKAGNCTIIAPDIMSFNSLQVESKGWYKLLILFK